MRAAYLKIPCEMALFAAREDKYKQVGCYTASLTLYSGNAHSSDRPVHNIASATGYPVKSVYRYFKWLINRNWFGKNRYNRYYFRGLDRVHEIEGWKYGRAAVMQEKDLQNIKAFLAGVVLASLAKTGKGERRERLSRGSLPTASPISLSVLADTLQVSESTAYRLRKLADKCNYIDNRPNLVQITNWTPEDLKQLRKQDVYQLPVELLGYADKRVTSIDRVRYKKNKLYLQEPNLIKPLIQLKVRRGLLDTAPYRGTNVSHK